MVKNKIKEKVGTAKKAYKYRWIFKKVPKCSPPLHIICFLLNIFFPGIGTLLAACYDRRLSGSTGECLLIGLVQLLLAPVLIGWIFSIVWGYLIYRKSNSWIMRNLSPF